MESWLSELGIEPSNAGASTGRFLETGGAWIESRSPATGEVIARVRLADERDYEQVLETACEAFTRWRMVPAPQRGEAVRRMGLALREHKRALGRLITLEMGKILAEGEGEVQEAIDIADFAVGLSRQLYGKTMASERPRHRMFEQWHPLGAIGIITAFNFPLAVWAWNAMIAAVCGDTMVWKPSLETPLTAIAMQRICDRVLTDMGFEGVMNLLVCDHPLAERLVDDRRLPLISATGSCRMGKEVGVRVAARLGRSLLELGGNNAIIVAEDADLDLLERAVLFGAVGTAGQRCTTTRRLIVHHSICDEVCERLVRAYEQIRIGDPLEEGTLVGPLINERAVQAYLEAIEKAKQQGGEVLYGAEVLRGGIYDRGHYVRPTIIRAPRDMPIVRCETFAPILYVMSYESFDEAIAMHNAVPQGLSSAIFTERLRTAERFLSPEGSDCGIANVNIGTSGAEIGGAFGGEKETGGGREAGSDAWKAYMRRQTCTINYSHELPLAQGIRFG
ncbi:MAG: aldehyde dehydrogenase family protein [Planctomycetota bacterium]|nr:MAG: aldehyde dehydrogenase family protein [Planctomycetota bacterium]